MGHYYSEMWSPFHEDELRIPYEKGCVQEIDDIINSNPLRTEDLSVDDKLVFYRELLKPSQVAITGDSNPSQKILYNLYLHRSWGTISLRLGRLYAMRGYFKVHELFKESQRVRINEKHTGWARQLHDIVRPVGFFERYSEEYDMKGLRW